MKNLKNLRIKEMIELLNKWEEKRLLTYLKFQDYKQKKKKEKYMKKFLRLDRLVVRLHNNIMKYIPKETMLINGKIILKSCSNTMWNNYTTIKFY